LQPVRFCHAVVVRLRAPGPPPAGGRGCDPTVFDMPTGHGPVALAAACSPVPPPTPAHRSSRTRRLEVPGSG
jgi:hypothetical protein